MIKTFDQDDETSLPAPSAYLLLYACLAADCRCLQKTLVIHVMLEISRQHLHAESFMNY